MLSLKISEQKLDEKITEAALDCLRKHSTQSDGVLTEDQPFACLAFKEERLVGGLIGKVFWNWPYVDLVKYLA